MRMREGLTLIEVVIALAVVAIVLGAMAAVQVQSVRASAGARRSTQVKAEANRVLEAMLERVSDIDTSKSPEHLFSHYYGDCGQGLDVNGTTQLDCSGTGADIADFTPSSAITSRWTIGQVPGSTAYEREGVMLLTVTSAYGGDTPTVTLGSAITCYDFFSGATATAPEPCPTPETP